MRKVLCLTILLTLGIAIVALTGCVGGGGEIVSGTGTVTYVDLEGGFYGIIGDNGEHYDPTYLGQEFQEDGLRVRFEAKIREDIASTHMWGTMIEISSIEKLTSG